MRQKRENRVANPAESCIIKLSNPDVRKNNVKDVESIDKLLNSDLPLEQKARQAFELRNKIKQQARDKMTDTEGRQELDEERPIPTWEQMLDHKMNQKGLSYSEALEDIIRTASETNEEVNKMSGVKSKNA